MERFQRMIKGKTKVLGGFRSNDGDNVWKYYEYFKNIKTKKFKYIKLC